MKLEIKNLTKVYKDKQALFQFNMAFENGIYGLLGANGAGKSTLMNLITDNIKRDDGEIFCDEKEILTMGKKYRRKIGYMPQQQGYYEEFSVYAYLQYMAELKEVPRKERKKKIEFYVERLNLSNVMYKKICQLSGGMRQRVMLAQTLLGEPSLLILDEPTAGLDPSERIRLRNFISELSKDKIILIATHVVSDIECIADKVLLMKAGKLVKTGTPQELILSMKGKVAECRCTKEEIEKMQKKYPMGNVIQRGEGLVFRIVGDEFEPPFQMVEMQWDLEDVYLYYCS